MEKTREFVEKWMASDPETFVRNKEGLVWFESEGGQVGINLAVYFEDLLDDYEEANCLQKDEEKIKDLQKELDLYKKLHHKTHHGDGRD